MFKSTLKNIVFASALTAVIGVGTVPIRANNPAAGRGLSHRKEQKYQVPEPEPRPKPKPKPTPKPPPQPPKPKPRP